MSERALEALESLRRQLVPEDVKVRPAHRKAGPADAVSSSFGSCTGPEHVARPGELFELSVPTEPRLDLGRWLIDAQGWPPAFAARNVDLFAAAVKRAFIEERGEEPVWDRGWVYVASDLGLVERVYEDSMGALAEQIAHEGVAL